MKRLNKPECLHHKLLQRNIINKAGVKVFHSSPGANVLYNFSVRNLCIFVQARVFVRLGWKSFTGTNTHIKKILKLRFKKSLITLGPGHKRKTRLERLAREKTFNAQFADSLVRNKVS